MGLEMTKLANGALLIQAKAPTPFKYRVDSSQKIIRYGSDNKYPNTIMDLLSKSAYGAACQRTFSKYLFGEGLQFEKETPFTKRVKEYILPDSAVQKICCDYTTFGGISTQVMFNMEGNVTKIPHVDFSMVRLGLYDEEYVVRKAWISPDWCAPTKKENKPVDYMLLDPIEAKRQIDLVLSGKGKSEDIRGQIFYAKQYKPGEPFYPTPTWSAAIDWVYLDGQIGVFQSKNIDNGFFPSTIIFHPGKLDGKTADGRSKKEAIQDDLEKFQGAEDAGKIFNVFGATPGDAPQVIQFTANTNTDLFNTLGDIADKKIVSGFQIPRMLAGIETPGALGGRNEIANAVEFYQSIVRSDVIFIENEINKLLALCQGYDGSVARLAPLKPVRELDADVFKYVDESEIRASRGLIETRPSVTNTGGPA